MEKPNIEKNIEELKEKQTETIYVDDLIAELKKLKEEINQKGLNKESINKIKEFISKVSFLEMFGLSSEENKEAKNKLEEWNLIAEKIEALLEKAKKLKKEGKEVVRIPKTENI